MSKRLFIGLELPGSIREELAAIDPRIKGLRWIGAENLHLTMSFLGNVDAEGEKRLREEISSVPAPAAFFLPVVGVGVFGGDWPKVVWAGVGKGHPHLFALHHHLQDAVLRAGLEADLKPFRPHITLGRAKGVPHAALKSFLRRHEETEFGLWKVSEVVLFSGAPGPEGSIHTKESSLEFPAY